MGKGLSRIGIGPSLYIPPRETGRDWRVQTRPEGLIANVETQASTNEVMLTSENMVAVLGPEGFSEAGYATIRLTFHSRVNEVKEIKFVINPGQASVTGIVGKAIKVDDDLVWLKYVKASAVAHLNQLTCGVNMHKRSQTGDNVNWTYTQDRGPLESEVRLIQDHLTTKMFAKAHAAIAN